MPTEYKPTDTYRKLKLLAESIPGSKYILPSLPEEVEEGREPLSLMTGTGTFQPGPIGMTTQQGVKSLLTPLFNRKKPISDIARKELSDTLRIWGATPKALKKYISKINISDPKKFGEHKSLGGGWTPAKKRLDIWPERSRSTGMEPAYKLSTVTGHEIGHSLQQRWLERMMKDLQIGGSPQDVYEYAQPVLEGVADYVSSSLHKKAGVPFVPTTYPYGKLERETFQALSKQGGNPWWNVQKYLNQLLNSGLD